MNSKDKIKIERISENFENNFKITSLYSEYLTRYPEVITKEMVDALTSDGETTREEAIVALLSEIFALDFSRAEDRKMIMNYLRPSVRILDRKKYENNPYYKNIKLENISEDNWEIRWESYAPYRAVICDDMQLLDDFCEIPPLGFFTERFDFPAILEGGNEWMTLTPVDLDTCEYAIERARGRVLTFGLGLGYYAYMASEKDEVESVTVVELSEKVIDLFKRHILPKMKNQSKINIIHADALEYAKEVMPKEHFDLVFADTWRDASDGAPMYRMLKPLEALCPGTEFLYWIENFLISRCRAENYVGVRDEMNSGKFCFDYEEFIKKIEKI